MYPNTTKKLTYLTIKEIEENILDNCCPTYSCTQYISFNGIKLVADHVGLSFNTILKIFVPELKEGASGDNMFDTEGLRNISKSIFNELIKKYGF